ncbi:hypothetical protein FB45DRAFT_916927 [Roridomyces roridus]|uniref:EamA domain-containing protein n=1 Tax=Roridomyces roridus TaxID=1738132 RepID=A0AAD7BUS5_9AGAR|nr:hypothetical protein FB45DRAFT_916927 [Roridomyces roridus]
MDVNPPNLGVWSLGIFATTLFAFVAESQLTQYLQSNLGYRQPFFIFYFVHSSFAIIFPLHLLYLTATKKNYSLSSLYNGLNVALAKHLTPERTQSGGAMPAFPRFQFLRLVFALTIGITYPSVLWFFAISLASVSDVTAIWNANAFFAYLMTFKCKWEPRKFFAVSLATIGVMIVIYGGSSSTNVDGSVEKRNYVKPTAPLVGDLMTLVASVGYAFYQVFYKRHAALPSDPELRAERAYESIPENDDAASISDAMAFDAEDVVYPPPFGLHPNLLTSAIGLCTVSVLWVFIPLLHYLDVEPFVLPSSFAIVSTIAGISLTGVIFNAGFMVLLSLWGPVVTSVANLLTIVLVFISDILFGAGVQAVTLGGVVGCAVIVLAFALLIYDMTDKRRQINAID